MAVKNFVFRENWVGSKVAGIKTTFITIFDPTWTHILDQKAQIKDSLNSILVKKDKDHIIINFDTLRLNKAKFLKIIIFLSFFTKTGQKFGPNVLSSYICLKFPLRCLYNH